MKQTSVKVKFGGGLDANRMTMRKMAVSFIKYNSLKTTYKRAKALKSYLDKIVSKSREKKESNKNFLLRELGNEGTVEVLFSKVGPSFKDISGGYIKVKRLGFRETDGADSAQIMWAHPIVLEEEEKQIKKSLKEEKKPVNKVKNEK